LFHVGCRDSSLRQACLQPGDSACPPRTRPVHPPDGVYLPARRVGSRPRPLSRHGRPGLASGG
jgi:hypothetical protein